MLAKGCVKKLAPLSIGALKIDFPVMLAPMAGYTDLVMRALSRRYGCGMAFTEVTSAEGFLRASAQTGHILDTAPGEAPVAAHFYGSNPEILAEAARRIAASGRFHSVDLNCGCPVAKIMAKGGGAALMKNPAKIAQIVSAIKKAVSLPVTVKTRLGLAPERMNIGEIGQAVQESGADAIIVHARFASGRHEGPPDWEVLAKLKSELALPVIGNGGIASGADALRMLAISGVDGIMIGKAAVGNPWIFSEIRAALHGQVYEQHALSEHRTVVEQHLRALIQYKMRILKARSRVSRSAELEAVLHFRGHLVGYSRGFKRANVLKRKLQDMRSVEDVMAAVDALLYPRLQNR